MKTKNDVFLKKTYFTFSSSGAKLVQQLNSSRVSAAVGRPLVATCSLTGVKVKVSLVSSLLSGVSKQAEL